MLPQNKIPYGHIILVSAVSNTAVSLPIMLLHRLPVLDSLGIAAIIGVTGAGPAMRACHLSHLSPRGEPSPREMRVLATKFTLFGPILILLLHAIVWTSVQFAESGKLLPATGWHWANWMLGLVAFVLWGTFYWRKPR